MLPPLIERLVAPLQELLALEEEIGGNAQLLQGRAVGCPPAAELLGEIEALAYTHAAALRERLQSDSLAGQQAVRDDDACDSFINTHPASTALRDAYALLQRAIVGYATVEPIAHRTADSWVVADAGTTSHIARDHTQAYVRAAGHTLALLHDVAIGELEAEGMCCQCTCIACGLGVCVCAVAGRAIFAEPWLAAKPPVAEHGVPLHIPCPGSAADAVLRKGDTVLSVEGKTIETIPHLQQALRGGASPIPERDAGTPVSMTVRRGARS